jgi:hypothetical protein
MGILNRSTGEPELLAALAQSQSELVRVEQEAATVVGRARGKVSEAAGRLDEHRRGQVRANAAAWRTRAQELRQQAEAAGDETVVERVVVLGGMGGGEVEPRLRFKSAVLLEEAATADTRAEHLEGRLSVGDALNGAELEVLVSQLEPLPAEAAEPVAQAV